MFFIISCAAVFAIGLYGSNIGYYTSSQIDVFLAINNMLPETPKLWMNITVLGDSVILLPLCSFFIIKNVRVWASLFGSIPLASVLSNGGKKYFAMPRPAAIIDVDQFTVIGDVLRGSTSLPSGHTITIFTAISTIIYIVICKEGRNYKVAWSMTFIFLASIIATSRVAVGAHWPVDLLLGAIFGVFSGLSGAILTAQYTSWWSWMKMSRFRYVHATILVALIVVMLFKYNNLIISWLSLVVAGIVFIYLVLPKKNNEVYL